MSINEYIFLSWWSASCQARKHVWHIDIQFDQQRYSEQKSGGEIKKNAETSIETDFAKNLPVLRSCRRWWRPVRAMDPWLQLAKFQQINWLLGGKRLRDSRLAKRMRASCRRGGRPCRAMVPWWPHSHQPTASVLAQPARPKYKKYKSTEIQKYCDTMMALLNLSLFFCVNNHRMKISGKK